ncbi:hypothetical protein B0H16DRAFT_1580035 [Mycena metata]|uniref:Uncharacterized protein n=1 Tax=Mycena metata TaxID=1033252 RepID=A0AAD7MUG2_9AGAR|nr:hypothetical protein B0H16DRAFT_1580035 [Mycena metata]
MSQQNTSPLVGSGVIAPAVAEISTQIHDAKDLFGTTKTQFNLVTGSTAATYNLEQASNAFGQFFLDAQTNASQGAANIQSFHGQALKGIADPTSASALNGITFMATHLGGITTITTNFQPIVRSLSASRQAVNILAASIDAARHAALDAAIKKVEDLETQGAALQKQFSDTLPEALKKLGMNADSSSLELYLTIAPASFLDSLIDTFKSKGAALVAKGEAGATEAGGEVAKDVVKAAVSTASLIELKEKIQDNKDDLAAAKLALTRLKEDQAADDQPGRLQIALISISQIQGAIAALSPQLQVLASVNSAMVQELNAAIALIKDGKYEEAKAGLKNADAVFTQLESALKSFSVEV